MILACERCLPQHVGDALLVRRQVRAPPKPASGAATTGRGGIITVSNTPCARRPVDDSR